MCQRVTLNAPLCRAKWVCATRAVLPQVSAHRAAEVGLLLHDTHYHSLLVFTIYLTPHYVHLSHLVYIGTLYMSFNVPGPRARISLQTGSIYITLCAFCQLLCTQSLYARWVNEFLAFRFDLHSCCYYNDSVKLASSSGISRRESSQKS